MILTGKGERRLLTKKAESDFLLWYYKQNDYQRLPFYDELTITHLHALIIEWLDSVGIYVNVSPRYIDHVLKYSVGDFYAVLNFKDGSLTLNACNYNSIEDRIYSRQQATEKAIEKAIEIYNERN